MGAEGEGAEVDILRLSDYHIQSCRGDARCLFSNWKEPCHIPDDFNLLLETMSTSDGVILGCPCYILESPAILKLIIDRMLSVGPYSKLKGKPAAIIVPYATRGWIPMSFVEPNILLLWLGMRVIHRALFHLQGISDALLDEASLNKAREIGKDIVHAIKTGDTTYKGEEGICPICHDWLLRILKDGETVECPVCAIRGELLLVNGKIKVVFRDEDIARHRWSEENIYNHFAYHIIPSRDYFLKTKEIRKQRKNKYENYLQIEREVLPKG
jgi:multimeric flavodoxin WrbA